MFLTFFKIISLFIFFSISGFSKCLIWIDSQRIVHVKAEKSSYQYCMGYVHGRYRSVQMDYFRRVALGRNAEIHGFKQLKNDMMMRLLDLESTASRLFADLSEDKKRILNDYASGVNKGFFESRTNKAGELSEGYPEVEKWSAHDSLLVLLLQSFDQTRKTFITDIAEANSLELWGTFGEKLLDQSGTPWDTSIIKENEWPNKKISSEINSNSHSGGQLWSLFPSISGTNAGSNNWVIHSKLSKTGHAWLANDPHLDLKTPLFWMWVHIETDESNSIGATLPGVPIVASGVGNQVSWGLTNAYFNTADVVELPGDSKLNSIFPLVWVTWYHIPIPIFFKRFYKTQSGLPILPLEDAGKGKILALRWSGFNLSAKDIDFIFSLPKAKKFEDVKTILESIGLPSWNYVYAGTNGRIGFRTIGKLFNTDSASHFGFFKGTEKDLVQPEFLSPDQNPSLVDPERGWIATANNRQFPLTASVFGGRAYTESFRAYRIEKLLTETKKHDLDSIKNIQCDIKAQDAEFLLPLIVPILEKNGMTKLASEFKKWNLQADEECIVCGVYRWSLRKAMDDLKVTESGFYKLALSNNQKWQIELIQSFSQGYKKIGLKKWKDIHVGNFPHITGNEKWKYATEVSGKGDDNSVSPGSAKWSDDDGKFYRTSGASEKMIVELSNPPKIWLALPGLNVNYHEQSKSENQLRKWETCNLENVQWPIDWQKVHSDIIE